MTVVLLLCGRRACHKLQTRIRYIMTLTSNISTYKINSTSIIRIRYGWIGRSVARGSHVTIYAVMTSATLWSL